MPSSELLSDELRSFCQSKSISEEGLRDLIERHGLTPKNNFDVRDYMFFNAACRNKRVTEGIIQCLLNYFPDAACATDGKGWTPLHFACSNKNMTLGIIQLLIDAAPDSVRSVSNKGSTPIHKLCDNSKLSEANSIQILEFLLEKHPGATRYFNNDGNLPIHVAAGGKYPEFCRLLIEAYPGSVRITGQLGALPFHHACFHSTLDMVEYFYQFHPDAIDHPTTNGRATGSYPIHCAIAGLIKKGNPAVVEIVKFLLNCDPNVKLQKCNGKSLLHYACWVDYTDSIIETALQIIKTIYDAHPEAIEEDRIVSDTQNYDHQVQGFINSELVYARQAKDHRLMTTPDENGRLPLHRALQNNFRLGSIKLLVKGNPSAIRNVDNNFALPLHIACEHHDSAGVVQYLLGLDPSTLDAVDRQGNTALHYACRGAKHDTIVMLLEKYDAVSVSKRDVHGKLPIDLLWESDSGEDEGSLRYTESVFQLLRAYPEMVKIGNLALGQPVNVNDETRNGKKRKFGHAA